MNARVKKIQTYIRIIGCVSAFLLALLSDYHKHLLMLVGLVIIYLILSLIAQYVPMSLPLDEGAHIGMVFFDVLMLSVAIGVRGGLRTDFYLGYFLILGYACMFRSKHLLIRLILWMTICYTGAVWFMDGITTLILNRIFIRVVMLAGASVMWQLYLQELLTSENMRQKALDLALKDELTGAYNRRMLNYISEEVDLNKKRMSVVMLDIDDFKAVNDTYGHSLGDEVLSKLTQIIHERLNDSGTCIRYGGEEFLLLLETCNEEVVRSLVKGILKEFSACKWQWKSNQVAVTFTAGMTIRGDYLPLEQLIEEADSALYEGKNNGKNIIVSYGQQVCREIL